MNIMYDNHIVVTIIHVHTPSASIYLMHGVTMMVLTYTLNAVTQKITKKEKQS